MMRLRSKIILLLIPVIILPFAITGGIEYGDRLQKIEQLVAAELRHEVEDGVNKFESHLDVAHSHLSLLAGSHIVDRYVRLDNEAMRYQLMYRSVMDLFNDHQRAFPEYTEIRLLLEDGYEDVRLASSTNDSTRETTVVDAWFQQLRHISNAPLTTLYHNTYIDNYTVLLARQAGRLENQSRFKDIPLAYIAINLELGVFNQWVTEQRIGEDGRLVLFGPEGMIADVNQLVDKDLERVLGPQLEQWPERTTIRQTFAGVDYYVTSQRLLDGLYIAALRPVAEVEAVVREMAVQLIGTLLVVTLLLCLILYSVLNRQILNPLNRLRLATEKLGRGEWDLSPGICRDDEIGQLSQSFITMSNNLQLAMQSLEDSSSRDSLTGLHNRAMFLKRTERAIEVASPSTSITVLFIDIDGFKDVNDMQGHIVGDLVLRDVAKRLQACVEELGADTEYELARLSGDEFTILLVEFKSGGVSEYLAQNIIERFKVPFEQDGNRFYLGASIGIVSHAGLDKADTDAVKLLQKADMAMYEAKRLHRNSFLIYNDKLSEKALRRHRLQSDLRTAISAQQLHLVYQPQINVSHGALEGGEALLRWQHPELGLISPFEFIPIAEETGLIVELGRWVVEQTCNQISCWQEQGLEPVKISVNISGVQFKQSDVREMLLQSLHSHGIPASLLGIEITESEIMDLDHNILTMLEQIKALGVWVALDDFGTGYSSLNSLKYLPIDNLKVDKSFIDDLDCRDGQSIFRAIIAMSKPLGVSVTAEGVEQESQLNFVIDSGCDWVQGYYYSKPVDAVEFGRMLEYGTVVENA